jgi:hypothetical protein
MFSYARIQKILAKGDGTSTATKTLSYSRKVPARLQKVQARRKASR